MGLVDNIIEAILSMFIIIIFLVFVTPVLTSISFWGGLLFAFFLIVLAVGVIVAVLRGDQ